MIKFIYQPRYFLFFLFTIGICNHSKAQQELGIKVGMGLSKMHGTYNMYRFWNKWEYRSPSYQLGLFYNYALSKKVGIGTELLYSNIGSKQSYYISNKDSAGVVYMEQTVNFEYQIAYLAIPLHLYYDYKKVRITIGVQNGFFVNGINKQTTSTVFKADTTHTFVNAKYKVDKFSLGIKAGIIYKINQSLSVEANYLIYKTNNEYLITAWNVQQVILGLRYKLFPKPDCPTCPTSF